MVMISSSVALRSAGTLMAEQLLNKSPAATTTVHYKLVPQKGQSVKHPTIQSKQQQLSLTAKWSRKWNGHWGNKLEMLLTPLLFMYVEIYTGSPS